MKKMIFVLFAALLFVQPVAVLASPHAGHGSAHNMEMTAAANITLPPQTVDGITATAQLKDIKATMAKMGMKHTHHIMVMFKDVKTGKEIEAKVAAVKVVDPSGKEGATVELLSMDGHAGTDVILAASGQYRFKVAAKLADGRKVQFDFVHLLN